MQPFAECVFHPNDSSPESEPAFAHALAIALALQASSLLNVSPTRPPAAETSSRDRPRALAAAGLSDQRTSSSGSARVTKKVKPGTPARSSVPGASSTDLVVLRPSSDGLPRLHGSVARRRTRLGRSRSLRPQRQGIRGARDGDLCRGACSYPSQRGRALRRRSGRDSMADAFGDPPVAITPASTSGATRGSAPPERWTWSGRSIRRPGGNSRRLTSRLGPDRVSDRREASTASRKTRSEGAGRTMPVAAIPVAKRG
jgi:hypothetical protein